jgi:hypothetical protein
MTDWLTNAVQINQRRRLQKYWEGREKGAAWLVECRDMWDAMDEDAGAYFVFCANEQEVEEALRQRPLDSPDDRVLGIYRLDRPLDSQGPGIRPEDWMNGCRPA